MAAAAVPIITAAIPLLRPVIKGLISGVQRIFGHNNGTGPTKLNAVVDAAVTVAEKMATAGKIPGQLDVATIASIVEAVVQEMKSSGELPSEGQPPAVSPLPQIPGINGGINGVRVFIDGTLRFIS